MTAANVLDTEKKSGVIGDLKYTIRDYDIQTYVTGGIAILPGDVGLKMIYDVQAHSIENPYLPIFVNNDTVHKKFVLALTTGTFSAGACGITVDGGTELSITFLPTETTAPKQALRIYTSLKANYSHLFNFSVADATASDGKVTIEALDDRRHTISYDKKSTDVAGVFTKTANWLKIYDVIDADGTGAGTTEDLAEIAAATDAGYFRLFILGK